jgi:hypothetical protein
MKKKKNRVLVALAVSVEIDSSGVEWIRSSCEVEMGLDGMR